MCAVCGGLAENVALSDSNQGKTIRYEFSIPSMSCGSCVAKIERHIGKTDGVTKARANLTLKRLVVEARENVPPSQIVETLKTISFDAFRIDDEVKADDAHERRAKALLRAVAVAGFGSANIMLLSVSSWAGAEGVTRDFMHFVSALIAVPVVAYSGRPFFRSAFSALSGGRVNMDVPISVAVLLAVGMSIFQTFLGEPEAYYDAAVMLLFFLLIGRYLDQLMRARARSAVVSLSEYAARDAFKVSEDGTTHLLPVSDVKPGMVLRIHAGSRVPADCKIIDGCTDLDRSMVTGESEPVSVSVGEWLEAGTLNLTGSIDVCVEKSADQSFLAEVTKMLDAAEQGRGKYVRIADRAARIYTPAVHTLAAAAFIGWMIYTGGDWQTSLLIAISVLIITCPCALGLAVPVAHVVAASCLFKNGLLMRDGAALERLAKVRHAVFDKTGTVTSGIKQVANLPELTAEHACVFATLASHSSHPTAMAICNHLKPYEPIALDCITELPGIGIQAKWRSKTISIRKGETGEGTTLILGDKKIGAVTFKENLRKDAISCIQKLNGAGVSTELLSGDAQDAVSIIAGQLGIEEFRYGQTPREKLGRFEKLRRQDEDSILMVGDGINDAPCLAAADVSIAPSSAADVGRQAADLVMARESLDVIPWAVEMAKATDHIVRQNFAIAIIYNCIAVPLALAGFVTPLIAALAMSGSSIVVIANSLRLMKANYVINNAPQAQTQRRSNAIKEAMA